MELTLWENRKSLKFHLAAKMRFVLAPEVSSAYVGRKRCGYALGVATSIALAEIRESAFA
jgi:hypothetical protein